jgi:hypothetical protein
VTATPTSTPVALERYTNPAYPYELGYPRGWQRFVTDPESIHFDGDAGRRISVEVQSVPQQQPPVTLPGYADVQVEALRKASSQFVELQRTRIILPNKTAAFEVDVTWKDGNTPRRALLLYVLDASIAFVVRAEVPPGVFNAERRVLDASLRSFTLTPPD